MTITVKVLLFASAREAAGNVSEVQCTLGADNKSGGRSGTDTTALRNTLADRYPKLAPLVLDEESITLALNEEYLTPGISKQLKQGDTVGEWRLDNDAWDFDFEYVCVVTITLVGFSWLWWLWPGTSNGIAGYLQLCRKVASNVRDSLRMVRQNSFVSA